MINKRLLTYLLTFGVNCEGTVFGFRHQRLCPLPHRKKKNNLFVAKTRTEYVHNNIESELFVLSNRQLRRDHWSSSQAATINQDTHGGRTYK